MLTFIGLVVSCLVGGVAGWTLARMEVKGVCDTDVDTCPHGVKWEDCPDCRH